MNSGFLSIGLVFLAGVALGAGRASATTHGDRLVGVGTAGRALGGSGVAVASDAVDAIWANPATLAFTGSGDSTDEWMVSGAFFRPEFEGRAGGAEAKSDKNYFLPAAGWAGAPSENGLAFGLGVYAVSGLGGDYRGTEIDASLSGAPLPRVATTRAELQVAELAPAVAWRAGDRLALGAALILNRGEFDLGGRASEACGAGFRAGLVFRPEAPTSLGLAVEHGASLRYREIADLDADGAPDDLRLDAPAQVRAGISREIPAVRLRLAAEARRFGWSDAAGYGDFGWRDAWLYGLAAEHEALPGLLVLRAGYNHGRSPVRSGVFNGTAVPGNSRPVQGKAVPAYYYETFRVISFPAVAEDHFAVGLGWTPAPGWRVDFAATCSPESSVVSVGTDPLGGPAELSSRLRELSLEFGVSRRF